MVSYEATLHAKLNKSIVPLNKTVQEWISLKNTFLICARFKKDFWPMNGNTWIPMEKPEMIAVTDNLFKTVYEINRYLN